MKTNETTLIPQGYKATPLGIIPQEWKIMPLYEAFHLQSGYAFKSEFFSTDQGIPIVRISNLPINNKYIDLSDCVYYPASENIKQQFIVHKKDLLIAMSGATTGKTAIYNYAFNAYLNQRVGVFKQTSDKVCYQYLQTIVESQLFTTKLQPLLIAGAQPNISPSDIENMTFPFPPLKEQQKIAEVLGVWDKAIEKQSQLIEQLTLRKRGLMQQLLTAKRRLPGFSGPWKVCVIQQLFTPVTTVNDGKPHLPMTISAKLGLISQQNKFDRVIAGDSLEKYTLIRYGDFAYNKGNSNLYEMGCIYQLKEESALVPFVYICFRAKEFVCGDFYRQYFLNHGLDRQLKRIITSGARGDGLLNVDKKDFFSLQIMYPSFEEQTAIAQVLTAADREIELAQQRLELLRQQKRGLMQQLLTGKKRVKNYGDSFKIY